jgi:hypothetical protein
MFDKIITPGPTVPLQGDEPIATGLARAIADALTGSKATTYGESRERNTVNVTDLASTTVGYPSLRNASLPKL